LLKSPPGRTGHAARAAGREVSPRGVARSVKSAPPMCLKAT